MSDRVVIQCPSCEKKLGIKRSMLGVEVKCPGCGTFLSARVKESSGRSRSSTGDSSGSRKRPADRSDSGRKSSSSASGRSRSSRSSSKGSASRSAADQNPTRRRSSSSSKKQRTKPTPVEDEFLDEDWGGAADDYADFDDYGDDYAESETDYYDDGQGDDWLDDGMAADWNAPASASPSSGPKKKKKKKSSESADASAGKKKRRKKKRRSNEPGSIVAWVGSGLLAGLISIVLTIAVGFTGIWFLLIIAGILSAGLIGGSIRAAAGSTDGWGPGLVAVFILLPSLFLGRFAAFYLNTDLIGLFGDEDISTPEESQAEIDRQTSEDGMIASLVVDELAYDSTWMAQNGLNEDTFYANIDWEEVDYDEITFAERYHEKVWAEGTRRWQEIPEEERTRRIEKRRQEMRLSAGLLTDQEIETLVTQATTEEALTERVADSLQYDFEWIEEAGLNQQEVWDFSSEHESEDSPEARVHPQVWSAAVRRWSEMDEAEKTELRAEAEMEIRFSQADVEQVFFFFVAIGATVYTLVMPISWLGCTISCIVLAFSSGSGLATG